MTTTSTLTRYRMYVGGEWVDAGSGDYFESDNPYLGEPWALIPRGTAADVDRAVRAAHTRLHVGGVAAPDRLTAWGPAAPPWRPDHPEVGRARRNRGPRQREAARRDERADGVHGAVVPLLRRPRRQDRGLRPSDRQARHVQLHALRAARRRRGHHSVELAAAADGVEAGAGAGGRQHGRDQAVRVHVGVGARVHEAGRGGRISSRRRQRRHRLWRGCGRAR